MAFELPMFPLGTVLVPGTTLPLHVFEPRYRALARDVTAGDGRFGVVLIARGSEVGGGDERCGVGTVAAVRDSEEFPDGRWALLGDGTDRLRVTSWRDDDPYPRAAVEPWPDADTASAEAVQRVEVVAATIVELARSLGHDVADPPATTHLDPTEALWRLVAASPLGPADRQALLECPGGDARAEMASALLDDQRSVLAALAAEDG